LNANLDTFTDQGTAGVQQYKYIYIWRAAAQKRSKTRRTSPAADALPPHLHRGHSWPTAESSVPGCCAICCLFIGTDRTSLSQLLYFNMSIPCLAHGRWFCCSLVFDIATYIALLLVLYGSSFSLILLPLAVLVMTLGCFLHRTFACLMLTVGQHFFEHSHSNTLHDGILSSSVAKQPWNSNKQHSSKQTQVE
jgi:hypothetical protein